MKKVESTGKFAGSTGKFCCTYVLILKFTSQSKELLYTRNKSCTYAQGKLYICTWIYFKQYSLNYQTHFILPPTLLSRKTHLFCQEVLQV